jgi:zinc/manganese transport system permease protein
MIEYLDLIWWPLLAAIVLTSIHVYLGLHVVTRGVIFVDLALAQVAALGTAVGVLIGLIPEGVPIYLLAVGFTFIGAILFTLTRTESELIPQEATIGITYVGAAAMMILLFSQSPEGAEHINHLLVGSILFVTPEIVGKTLVLYIVIGLFHWRFRNQFVAASKPAVKDVSVKSNLRLWDLLFFITFGLVVTGSVKIAGVLLVFSYLIIPAVAAILFFKSTFKRLLFGWMFSIIGSMIGMLLSLAFDLPTGATIIVTFALMLSIAGIFFKLRLISSQ